MKNPDNFKDFLLSELENRAIEDNSKMQIATSVSNILTTSPILQSLGLFQSVSQQEEFASKVSDVVTSEDFIEEISDAVGTPSENETEEAFIARAKLVFKNRLRDRFS